MDWARALRARMRLISRVARPVVMGTFAVVTGSHVVRAIEPVALLPVMGADPVVTSNRLWEALMLWLQYGLCDLNRLWLPERVVRTVAIVVRRHGPFAGDRRRQQEVLRVAGGRLADLVNRDVADLGRVVAREFRPR